MAILNQDTSFGWASNDASALVNPHLEYYRKNRWILDFGGLPSPLTAGEKVILRLNAKTAMRPKKSFEDTKVERINGTVKLPGKPTIDDLSVVFYDAIKLKNITPQGAGIPDYSTSDVIERWLELIHQASAGDAYGAAGNFKGWAHLHMLEPVVLTPGSEDVGAPDSGLSADSVSNAISQTWLYQGIYPKSIEYGALDYGSSDVMEVTVNFSVDRGYRVKTGTLSM